MVKKCCLWLEQLVLVRPGITLCSCRGNPRGKKRCNALAGKLQIVQSRAAQMVIPWNCRMNIVLMHKCLNWLLVKDTLLYLLVSFIRNVSVTKTLLSLYQNLFFSTDIHNYTTRHTATDNFNLSKVKTNAITWTLVYRSWDVWNSLPRHITQENMTIKLRLAIKHLFLNKCIIHLLGP